MSQVRSIVKKIKHLVRFALGKDFITSIDGRYETETHGSEYGSWTILKDSIDEKSVIYSFGVGEDISFDTSLIEKYKLTIHAFDPTPQSISWVKEQHPSSQFIMHTYGLADFDGEIAFNPPEISSHVSYTILDRPKTKGSAIIARVKRLSTIKADLGHDRIDILKMDIEGAEYSVIDDICASDIRPKQILVEFHHRFPNVGIGKSKAAIRALRAVGYQLFHSSPTNEEFSFVLT